MLRLRFEHPLGGRDFITPPAPSFWTEGERLRAAPDGREVAVHHGYQWRIDGIAYITWWPLAPALIHFRSPEGLCSGPYGPFDLLLLVDGVIRYGPDLARILAHFDEPSRSWCVGAERTLCPTMLLEPA
jgi:hypothetical protein